MQLRTYAYACIQVFVGVFFATIAIQRIVQRHMHLLNMRTAAQRFPVVDLGEQGDALEPARGQALAPDGIERT